MRSETDYAYLAGFIDGEGCFMVQNSGVIALRVANASLELLEDLSDMFGGTIQAMQAPKKDTHRQCYQWHVGAKCLKEWAVHVLPYCKYRKRDMELVVAYYDPSFGYQDSRKGPIREEMREHLRTRRIIKESK